MSDKGGGDPSRTNAGDEGGEADDTDGDGITGIGVIVETTGAGGKSELDGLLVSWKGREETEIGVVAGDTGRKGEPGGLLTACEGGTGIGVLGGDAGRKGEPDGLLVSSEDAEGTGIGVVTIEAGDAGRKVGEPGGVVVSCGGED